MTFGDMQQLRRELERTKSEGITEIQVLREECTSALRVQFMAVDYWYYGNIGYEELLKALESNMLEFLVEDFWSRPMVDLEEKN